MIDTAPFPLTGIYDQNMYKNNQTFPTCFDVNFEMVADTFLLIAYPKTPAERKVIQAQARNGAWLRSSLLSSPSGSTVFETCSSMNKYVQPPTVLLGNQVFLSFLVLGYPLDSS